MYFLIHLSGQGDTTIKIIDEDAWNWMGALYTDWQAPCPESVLAKMRKEHESLGFKLEKPNITRGSADNDAALWIAPEIINGKEARFDTMKEALDFIKAEKIDIQDTYEGYIY